MPTCLEAADERQYRSVPRRKPLRITGIAVASVATGQSLRFGPRITINAAGPVRGITIDVVEYRGDRRWINTGSKRQNCRRSSRKRNILGRWIGRGGICAQPERQSASAA